MCSTAELFELGLTENSYAMQWLVVLPLEIVAASLTIQYWTSGSINNNAFVALFLFLIIGINLSGVRGYGEAEFVFSIIKVVAVVGYIILGVILNVGGGPEGGYIGGKSTLTSSDLLGTQLTRHPLQADTGSTQVPSTTASEAFARAS